MKEIALHVLDIAQNAIEAGASTLWVSVTEEAASDLLVIEVVDNGRGMPADVVARVKDPFVTTRTTRRVGLGLPLLAETARQSGGSLVIESSVGGGTKVRAIFRLGHIDRPPLGDMAATVACLMAANPALDVVYVHRSRALEFRLSSAELRQRLDGVSLGHPSVFAFVRDYLASGIREVSGQRATDLVHDASICALPNLAQSGGENTWSNRSKNSPRSETKPKRL